jgi:hypothetical protein
MPAFPFPIQTLPKGAEFRQSIFRFYYSFRLILSALRQAGLGQKSMDRTEEGRFANRSYNGWQKGLAPFGRNPLEN